MRTQGEVSLLCQLYGSDKGSPVGGSPFYPWAAHTYAPVYEWLFAPLRGEVRKVFECGLGTNNPGVRSSMGAQGQPGASLRVWRDYFPGAMVVGADIDRAVLFSEERIVTGYLDQTAPDTIAQFFASLASGLRDDFDIMIDDGLHTFEAARCLLENALPHLKSGGFYIIEDMPLEAVSRFKAYFAEHPSADSVRYMLMSGSFRADNNLIIVKKG
jgi:hypothetical protein